MTGWILIRTESLTVMITVRRKQMQIKLTAMVMEQGTTVIQVRSTTNFYRELFVKCRC